MATSNKATTGIVIGIGLIVAIGVFIAVRSSVRQRKRLEDSMSGEGGETGLPTGGTTSEIVSDYKFTAFPIKWKDSNEDVRQLQLLLLKYDNTILRPFGADGKFGSVTESALKKVINKKRVDNQADIEAIKKAIVTKAQKVSQQAAINIALGIPIYK